MDEVSQIRQKIDIVSLISESVPLKKMGRNFKGVCPFHTEKTPSFVVSPERQIWHCFGCSKGGDIFTFLMEFDRLEFVEALRILAKRAGVTLSARSTATTGASKKKDQLYKINHLAQEFYHYILQSHKKGEAARAYLKNRGITEKIITLFKLGFAPSDAASLFRYLREKKGFSAQDIEDAGLILRAPTFRDRFRNRIMFPLSDHRGNIVGFSGRILTASPDLAKYVNTPETLLYHKGDLLYGLDLGKEAIRKKGTVILVEGEFDVIQAKIHGIDNIVAIKGTALTESQIATLRRFTEKVSICLDQDVAGVDAQWRGIALLEEKGVLTHVIELPSGKDPDECLRQNPSLFYEAVKKEVPVYDFLLHSAVARHNKDTLEGKKSISDELIPFLARIQNEIIKNHYVKKLSEALSVSEESIVREMERTKKESTLRVVSKPAAEVKTVRRPRNVVIEEYLLALLLQAQQVGGSVSQVEEVFGGQMYIETPVYQKIYLSLKEFSKKNEKNAFSITEFIKGMPTELHSVIDTCYLFSLPPFFANPEDEKRHMLEVEKTATEIKALSLHQKMQALTVKMREHEEAKKDEDTLLKLKEEFNLLLQNLRTLTLATLSDSSSPTPHA